MRSLPLLEAAGCDPSLCRSQPESSVNSNHTSTVGQEWPKTQQGHVQLQ